MTQESHFQAYTLRKPKLKKDTCIPLFIAALFTIARTWKQPRCPSTDEWIKLWHIFTRDYYSAIKRKAFESVLMSWMNLEPIIQSKVSQKEKDKYHIHIYALEYSIYLFFLTHFTLYNRFQIHSPHQNWLKCVPFYG